MIQPLTPEGAAAAVCFCLARSCFFVLSWVRDPLKSLRRMGFFIYLLGVGEEEY